MPVPILYIRRCPKFVARIFEYFFIFHPRPSRITIRQFACQSLSSTSAESRFLSCGFSTIFHFSLPPTSIHQPRRPPGTHPPPVLPLELVSPHGYLCVCPQKPSIFLQLPRQAFDVSPRQRKHAADCLAADYLLPSMPPVIYFAFTKPCPHAQMNSGPGNGLCH